MNLLKTHIHEALKNLEGNCEKRIAARGVILKNNKILLLYTNRYNDYSLPGGGIDLNESLSEGLIRELEEETGARNIQIEEEIGVYEEYRPCNKNGFQLLHMLSYIYKVNCSDEFVECNLNHMKLKMAWKKYG